MQVKEKHIRYTGIVVLSLMIFLASSVDIGIIGLTHNLVISFINWQGAVLIMWHYQNKYPKHSQALVRILLEFVVMCLFILGLVTFNHWLASVLYNVPCHWSSIPQSMAFNLVITLFIGAFYESRYLFERWQESVIETQKLRRQTTQSQLEVLKNQVNPHFLFNSLNTLLTLIPEDKKTAQKFTRKLEVVYRYILQHQNQELTTVAREFEFIKAYLFLQQIRFGDNLKVQMLVEKEYLQHQIVPLSLQMLVENAIKHNVISSARPLYLNIITKSNRLIVRNNLQPKKVTSGMRENSTHIGLKNIKDRYAFFTQQPVAIQPKVATFEVRLPLLEQPISNKSVTESSTPVLS
ncbi:sensor histidine kinase [uncultured Microscilla sp.]|uniref:sensor histidine kinase n=1 Tax=uncultured Microscilla sp. TaxID=432653 RepID=UPI0026154816|nr:histidine kinase [uncultured Microscilla sp.]